MARLTEEMVVARTRQSDLASVKRLNCWGVDLTDVSLVRRMPNVEIIAMSLNKITTLEDFSHCRHLRELYIRQNSIGSISEIRHLKGLDRLRMLWLDENPCCQTNNYRYTVLRNLPYLEKLDDKAVSAEEVEEAMRRGVPIGEEEEETAQEEYAQYSTSRDCSPERQQEYRREQANENSDAVADSTYRDNHNNGYSRNTQHTSPTTTRAYSPEPPDDRFEYTQPSRQSYYESVSSTDLTNVERAPNMPHSQSAQSVKEYSNGSDGPRHRASPHYRHSADYEHFERSDSYQQIPQRCPLDYEARRERDSDISSTGRRERDGDMPSGRRERDGDMPSGRREREGDIASAVMAERRGFTRRPVTRNSNLLSAVLCLVKELDYPSLEVTEMAVRCRMDELADQQ